MNFLSCREGGHLLDESFGSASHSGASLGFLRT
jgi:hypothetical protein